MNEFSCFPGRVDHEVRFAANFLWSLSRTDEPHFYSKISKNISWASSQAYLNQYLESCYLDCIVLRSLPLVNLENHVRNLNMMREYGHNISSSGVCNVKYITPITPYSPTEVYQASIDLFGSQLLGFELIADWFSLSPCSAEFRGFLERIDFSKYVLCIEVDHCFRSSNIHLH